MAEPKSFANAAIHKHAAEDMRRALTATPAFDNGAWRQSAVMRALHPVERSVWRDMPTPDRLAVASLSRWNGRGDWQVIRALVERAADAPLPESPWEVWLELRQIRVFATLNKCGSHSMESAA